MGIAIAFGTRPQIVKSAPIVYEALRCGLDLEVIHTGQHYDYLLSQVFIEEFGLPEPVVNLGVGSGSHAYQTGEIMLRLEKYLASLVALLAVMTSTEDLLNLASIGGGVKYVGPLISRALSVIGLGYVGLPTAVLFASKSLKVVGVDIDASKVEAVNSGRCYLREPGLAELLRDAVSKGFLRATTDAIRAVRVRCRDHRSPTPVKGGVAALSHLRDALESVKEACSPPWSTRFCLGPLRLAELLPEGSELRVVLL